MKVQNKQYAAGQYNSTTEQNAELNQHLYVTVWTKLDSTIQADVVLLPCISYSESSQVSEALIPGIKEKQTSTDSTNSLAAEKSVYTFNIGFAIWQ